MSQRSKGMVKAEKSSKLNQEDAPSSQRAGKGKNKRLSEDMESDSDNNVGSQMLSQGGVGSSAWAGMSEEDKKVSCNKLINFMLMRDANKLPVKRADISDLFKSKAMGGKAPPAAVITQLIQLAKQKIRHVYGFELVELDSTSINDDVGGTQMSQSSKGNVKSFMLKNALKYPMADDDEGLQEEDEEKRARERERKSAEKRADLLSLGETPNKTPHYHLALCLMTAICLQRYSMTEKELWAVMDRLGLKRSMTDHSVFGSTVDTVRELVSQGYLHIKKSKDREGNPQVMYCLGLRGEEEVTRLRMLNWAEEIFDEKMLDSTKMDLLDPAEEEEEEAADQ